MKGKAHVMARHIPVPVVMAIILSLLLVLTGCGTLDIGFDTTVKPSGAIIQKVRMEASGMMAEMLTAGDLGFDSDTEGWQISIDVGEDSVTAIATRSFSSVDSIAMPGSEGEETIIEDISFRSQGSLWAKDYFFEATVPGSGIDLGELDLGEEFDQFLTGEIIDMFLEDFLSVSWTITMPGDIVDSNADIVEGNSATWELGIPGLGTDTRMAVQSRATNWPLIAGLSAVAAVLLGLVIFLTIFFITRRGAAQAVE